MHFTILFKTLNDISSKYMNGFDVDDKNGKIEDERRDVKSVITVLKVKIN